MNTSPRTRLVGGLLAGSLVLGACGSSAETESTAVTETAETAEAAETTETTDSPETTAEIATESTSDSTSESADVGTGSMQNISASGYFGSYTLDDDEFGTMVTVTVDGGTRTVVANALPDHETGEFPNAGNPNTISEQDTSYSYTTEPTYTGDATPVRTTGVAVNGVKFEPGTGETVTCASGESYRIEALQDVYNLGLDFNNAHVQPTGEYHYHGISELLVDAYESDQDLVHVGFAADGFLMYYSKTNAYDSGYALTTDARTGSDCVVSGPGGTTLDLEGTEADGAYTSDWVYSEADGNLDSCNGTTVDGQYVYIVTDSYPFISRCLNGEASGQAGGPPPGGGPPPQS